jgi:hypothetical protein
LRTKEPPEPPLLVISNPKKTNGFYERPLASSLTFSYFLRIAVICRIRFFECCENRKIRRPHTHSDNRTVYFPHFKKLPTALTRGLTRLSAWSWFRLALHSFAEDIQQIDPTAAGPIDLSIKVLSPSRAMNILSLEIKVKKKSLELGRSRTPPGLTRPVETRSCLVLQSRSPP